jgi:hypothetical protein
VTKVFRATWQRCRVHFMRNAVAHAGKTQRRIVAAWIGTAYAQEDAAAAHAQWRTVADQFRPKVPRLAALMDEAEDDVLAYMHFPAAHRTKLHSTNPIERLNGEIKRRTDVVGIFPNEAAVLVGRGASDRRRHPPRAVRRMGHPTRPLHDPGDHRRRQRYCHRQPARRGRLTRRPNPPRIIALLHHAMGHDHQLHHLPSELRREGHPESRRLGHLRLKSRGVHQTG